MAPPVVLMSPASKPVGASEKVKVMVAVSPALSAVALLVIARVGAVESIVTEADEAVLRLPAASTV